MTQHREYDALAPSTKKVSHRKEHSYRHEALILMKLGNPNLTNKEVAEAMGYDPATLSILMRSDGFRSKFNEMREAVETAAKDALLGRTRNVLLSGLDATQDRFEDANTTLSEINGGMKNLLGAVGMGGGSGSSTNVAVQVNQGAAPLISAEVLKAAADKIGRTFEGETMSALPVQGASDLGETSNRDARLHLEEEAEIIESTEARTELREQCSEVPAEGAEQFELAFPEEPVVRIQSGREILSEVRRDGWDHHSSGGTESSDSRSQAEAFRPSVPADEQLVSPHLAALASGLAG